MEALGQLATLYGFGPALLLLAVWAFATGRVFSKTAYDNMRTELSRERDDWKTMALRATNNTDRALGVVEPLVKGPQT